MPSRCTALLTYLALSLCLSLVTCSGGGSTVSTVNPGTLTVNIIDLPPGVAANVSVTDPNGQVLQLVSSQTLTTTTAGVYNVTASSVPVGTSTYHATAPTQQVTMTADGTATVTVDYYNIIPNTTKVLDQTGTQSLMLSPDGNTLQISSSSNVALSLKPGDVLVVPPSAAAPDGLLRKVLSVSDSGGIVVVVTAPATLADEVTRAQISAGVPIVAGQQASQHYNARRALLRQGSIGDPCTGDSSTTAIPFSVSLSPDSAGHTVTATGDLEVCALQIIYKFDSVAKTVELAANVQEYSQIVVQGQYSGDIDQSIPLSATELATQVVCLGNNNCQAALDLGDTIGGNLAAFVIKPVISPSIGMRGNASGALYLGGEEGGGLQAGLSVQNDSVSNISYSTLQAASFPTGLDANVNLKGFIEWQLGFQVFGSVTGYVTPRDFTQLNADTNNNPWWTLQVGGEAQAGIVVSLLGFFAHDYSTPEFQLFSHTVASAVGPFSGLPILTTITPNACLQNSSAQNISLAGSNFVPGAVASFNGTSLLTTYGDPTTLTAVLPAGALLVSGSYPLMVTNPDASGSVSNSLSFTVVSLPTGSITINPTSATVPEGAIKAFAATVTGGGNVTWSMQEGVTGGTVIGGVYTAPNTTGTFHVIAANALDSSKTASATITVVLPEQGLARLTNDPATDDRPAWSPQGNTIAFISTSGHSVAGIYDLWAIAPDGSNVRQLTSVPDVAFSFGVASLAWIGSSGNFYILDTPSLWYWYLFPLSITTSLPVDPTTLTAIMSVPGGLGSSWLAVSPDGTSAAWDTTTTQNATCPSSTQLRLAATSSLTGQDTTVAGNLIATGTLNCGTYGGESIMGVSFSPDGSQIVISRTPDPNYYGFDLEIYKTDGTFIQKLMNNGGGPTPVINNTPSWSSDNRIAFASNSTGQYQIYTINPDGSNLTQITTNGGTSPSWSSDASKIAFASDRTGNSQIYTIPAPH